MTNVVETQKKQGEAIEALSKKLDSLDYHSSNYAQTPLPLPDQQRPLSPLRPLSPIRGYNQPPTYEHHRPLSPLRPMSPARGYNPSPLRDSAELVFGFNTFGNASPIRRPYSPVRAADSTNNDVELENAFSHFVNTYLCTEESERPFKLRKVIHDTEGKSKGVVASVVKAVQKEMSGFNGHKATCDCADCPHKRELEAIIDSYMEK
eukprot:CAMPEP_0168517558 /NCGR_PEP_ID=MMETSP0405-20121227/6117_1 /TAXON_ID=498012 /ORGANISM="Trichosphaerium sp, Strain Am-I-7 wt" /LENGTH=205 /DNA_ID=CAMNT_0008537579 /DNA_START=222 /DNA_END=839 /DNA_ORIENTATION=+